MDAERRQSAAAGEARSLGVLHRRRGQGDGGAQSHFLYDFVLTFEQDLRQIAVVPSLRVRPIVVPMGTLAMFYLGCRNGAKTAVHEGQ